MHPLPIPDYHPKHALSGGDIQVDLISHDFDGRAEIGALLVPDLRRFQFFFIAANVVDDGNVFCAVAL